MGYKYNFRKLVALVMTLAMVLGLVNVPGAFVKVYADEGKCTLTLHANYPNGNDETKSIECDMDQYYNFTGKEFEFNGYKLIGWNKYKDAQDYGYPYYSSQSSIYMSEDAELYASWSKSINVKLESNYPVDGKQNEEVVEESYANGTVYWEYDVFKCDDYELMGFEKVNSEYENLHMGNYYIDYDQEEDVVLRAVWKQLYDITFDANGGSFYEDKTSITSEIAEGRTIGYGEYIYYPEKDGKVFKGWTTNENIGDLVAGEIYSYDYLRDVTVTKDMTFTAVWADEIVVTFNYNGGYYIDYNNYNSELNDYEKVTTKKVIVGEGMSINESYEFGYDINEALYEDNQKTFLAWKVGDNSYDKGRYTDNSIFDCKFDSNTEVKAEWVENLTITFDYNGGYYYGDYDLDGYKKETTKQLIVGKGMTINDMNNDNIPIAYYENDAKEYLGWQVNGEGKIYTNSSNEDDSIYDYAFTENTTVKAKWANIYTVTFDYNGGKVYDETSQDFQVTEGKTLANAYAIPSTYNLEYDDDHAFVGWKIKNSEDDVIYVDDLNDENKLFIGDYEVTGDVTFEAVWTDYVDVTFNAGEGSFYEDSTYVDHVPRGSFVNYNFSDPEREGYYFRGYKVDGDDTLYVTYYEEEYPEETAFIYNYVANDAITFNAVWEKRTTVTFVTDKGNLGEEGVMSKSYYYEIDDEICTWYEKQYPVDMVENVDGYRFVGWQVEGDDAIYSKNRQNISQNIYFIDSYVVKGDVTFTAVWEEVCEVKFVSDEGYIYGDANIKTSESVFIKKDSELAYEIPTINGRDGWAVKGYTVDGDTSGTLYVERDSSLGSNEKCIYEYKVTKDVVFKAVWAQACKVTYISKENYIWADETLGKLEKVYAKDSYISDQIIGSDRPGYVFDGWVIEGDSSGTIYNYFWDKIVPDGYAEITSHKVTKDITFVAKWKQAFNITFRSDEGYIYGNEYNTEVTYQVLKGESISTTPSASWNDHVVVGWKDVSTNIIYYVGSYTDFGSSLLYDFVPNSDVILEAVWKEAYNITFYSKEKYIFGDPETDTYNTRIVKGGSDISVPEITGYEGKVCVGWKIEGDESGTVYVNRSFGLSANEISIWDYNVTSDIKFIAVWVDGLNIKFYTEKGSFNENYVEPEVVVDILAGEKVNTVMEPYYNKTDFEFAGWKIQGGDDTVYTSAQIMDMTPDKSLTFIAVWKAKGGDNPGGENQNPGTQNPGTQTSTDNKTTKKKKTKVDVKGPKAGTIISDGKFNYKVKKMGTTDGSKIGEVSVKGLVNKNVKNVVIADTVTIGGVKYKVTMIERNAFKFNKKIKKVTIGANVTNIAGSAFAGCKNITKVSIKSLLITKIGNKAFFREGKKKVTFKVPKAKKKLYKKMLKRAKSDKFKVK